MSDDSSDASDANESNSWSGEHRKTMNLFQARWDDAPDSQAARRGFIAELTVALLGLKYPPPEKDLAKVSSAYFFGPSILLLCQRIRAYLNNNTSKRGRQKKRKRPTRRALVVDDNREEFTKQANALVLKEGIGFVGAHSRLVGQKMAALTKAEKAALDKRRDDWVQKGPPPSARRM